MNTWVMIECVKHTLETEIDIAYLEEPDWSGDALSWFEGMDEYWENSVEFKKWSKGK